MSLDLHFQRNRFTITWSHIEYEMFDDVRLQHRLKSSCCISRWPQSIRKWLAKAIFIKSMKFNKIAQTTYILHRWKYDCRSRPFASWRRCRRTKCNFSKFLSINFCNLKTKKLKHCKIVCAMCASLHCSMLTCCQNVVTLKMNFQGEWFTPTHISIQIGKVKYCSFIKNI